MAIGALWHPPLATSTWCVLRYWLCKLSMWLRYVDDLFVVWPHGPEQLQNFLSYLNSLRPVSQFHVEIEGDSGISFLHLLVLRKETTLTTKVYRKPTHTGRYLNFTSNHPLHMLKKLHGLSPRANYIDRATAACRRSDCQLLRIEGATWSA
jgi:hypothetical protein